MTIVQRLAAMLMIGPTLVTAADPLLTGPKFRAELEHPLTASWDNVELRDLLVRSGRDRRMAIVLDRRVDPNRSVRFSFEQEPFLTGLKRLAEMLGVEISAPENLLYIGPPETARWLRTSIAAAEERLSNSDVAIPERRQSELKARKTVRWDDLTTPKAILTQIADAHKLAIDSLERVPHDLWAATILPEVTAAEALTVVLCQMDLSFQWSDKGRRIELLPWQTPALIERTVKLRGTASPEAQVASWREKLPGAEILWRDAQMVVRGRVEDHEQIRLGLSSSGPRALPGADRAPLNRRSFTLRTENTPARAVLRELEKSGVSLVIDEAGLRAAGVNLDQLVTVEVKKATAAEFLKAVLDPIGAQATFEDFVLEVRAK